LCCPVDYVNKKICHFVLTHGYSQVVDFPTRGNNILDVILTDDDCIVTAVKPCPPVGYSDHCAIEFTMSPTPVERNVPAGSGDKYRYLWHIGDYDYMINYLLCVDWNAVLYYNPSAEKCGRLLVMFCGPLLICMFHHVLAVETVRVVTRKESQKSRTNCENVLRENAHDSNLHCKYRESVHLWRELLRANECA